jgi:hypothetical protein
MTIVEQKFGGPDGHGTNFILIHNGQTIKLNEEAGAVALVLTEKLLKIKAKSKD